MVANRPPGASLAPAQQIVFPTRQQPTAPKGEEATASKGKPKFQYLPLRPATQAALESMGFTEMTPVQAEAIPALLEGRDLIGQAQTGTGKTAAFGIPLVEAAQDGRRAIVLAPTRELAKQVQQELQAIGKGSPVDVLCLIGGAPFRDQARAVKRHPDASIVATPGRVVDHLSRGTLDLRDISLLVLDEADEMLSMGFADELDAIIQQLPEERQNVLFSATMAPAIEKLAKKTLHDPVTVRMGQEAAPDVRQGYLVVAGRERLDAVRKIMEAEAPRAALLFAKTRARVDDLVQGLQDLDAEALHGGMGQPVREAVMRRFRDGKTRLLVATDVASRGLDVEEIDLVLHDEPAGDVDTYIHRIGRTGRAGRSGASILFVKPGKQKRLGHIRKVAGRLEQYTLPGDAELQAIRMERQVQDLRDQAPTREAIAAYKTAIAAGLDPEDIAIRALEMLRVPAPEPIEAAPPTALALKVGKMDNIHPGAIVGMLTNAGGLKADDIGRIDILDKMSVVEVPADQMDRLCNDLGRVRLSGRPVKPRPADDWRFKTGPKKRW